MIEDIAARTRDAYSCVRDIPALPIKNAIDKTPVLNAHIILDLVGQVRDAVPQSIAVDTLLGMGVDAETKASLATAAFEGIGDTSNEHAIGAMAAIGTMRTVATEFVGQIAQAKTAHEHVIAAIGELYSALMTYRIAAHDAYRPAEIIIEARQIATQELKAYYTDIMGPDGEIREE